MVNLFEQYDSIEQLGSKITIPDYFPAIYVSEKNTIYCYIGIFLGEDHHNHTLYMHPYYMHGKHSTDKRFANRIKGFFRVVNGYITIDKFVDEMHVDQKYKKLDAFVRYPIAAETYYGIWKKYDDEDEGLTRAVFGLTYSELIPILEGYATVLGIKNDYIQYPRLTRSMRSENYCDITGLIIPAKLPYITFKESSYDFSHVSLWGFYRHVQLLLENSITSRFGKALLVAGVPEESIEALLCVEDYMNSTLTKVVRNTLP